MAYRDVLFAPLVSVFLLKGLDDESTAALRPALRAVLHHRREARRRPSGSAMWSRPLPAAVVDALVDRHVHRLPNGLTDAEMIAAAHDVGLAGLPIAIATSGDRCAVVTAHAVFDGTGSLQVIQDLLDAMAGAPLMSEQSPARVPVLQALRRVRPADVRSFIDARRGRPEAPAASPTPPPATSAAFALGAADLAAIRRYREPDRVGRATLHSRIASLMVAALREVATSDVDIPVWMTSDIRHLADGTVDGNFITRELVGTLHGDQWAPGALAARMVRLKEPGQALALVWGPTGWLIKSALGRKPIAGEEIVLTLASTQRGFSAPVSSVTATSIGGSPTFGFAWQNKSGVYVSMYNSSGRFDLDRFEKVFRRIVAERAGAAQQ